VFIDGLRKAEIYAGFWWGNVKETELGVDGRIIIRQVLMKSCGRMGDRMVTSSATVMGLQVR
jgi:hypothetical protein